MYEPKSALSFPAETEDIFIVIFLSALHHAGQRCVAPTANCTAASV